MRATPMIDRQEVVTWRQDCLAEVSRDHIIATAEQAIDRMNVYAAVDHADMIREAIDGATGD